MSEVRVSMTELRQRLGALVNQAAYGDERIVLVSHGQPKAAIIGVTDLERLKQLGTGAAAQPDRYAEALTVADHLRERVQRWQETHSVEPEDSVTTLHRLWEERG